MDNILIRQIKLPLTVRGFTVCDPDGDFNIYINEELSDEAKRRSLEHEKEHIKRNDFIRDEIARNIEADM